MCTKRSQNSGRTVPDTQTVIHGGDFDLIIRHANELVSGQLYRYFLAGDRRSRWRAKLKVVPKLVFPGLVSTDYHDDKHINMKVTQRVLQINIFRGLYKVHMDYLKKAHERYVKDYAVKSFRTDNGDGYRMGQQTYVAPRGIGFNRQVFSEGELKHLTRKEREAQDRMGRRSKQDSKQDSRQGNRSWFRNFLRF